MWWDWPYRADRVILSRAVIYGVAMVLEGTIFYHPSI